MTFAAFPGHATYSLRNREPLDRWRSLARITSRAVA
jgi:hypothetical protein